MNPKLIIADECISALDVSIQAQVVNLMKDIQKETGTALSFSSRTILLWSSISRTESGTRSGTPFGNRDNGRDIPESGTSVLTKSLLSAIPAPNPVVEKSRKAEIYDYKTSGISYDAGTEHLG